MDSASAAAAAMLRSHAANATATPYAGHWELQDLFFLAYLGIVVALLLGVGVWSGRVDNPWHLLFYHFLIGAAGTGAQRLPLLWKHPLARFIRWWYPALLFPFCFEAVGQMIHLLQPQLIDAYLMTADRFLFGRELTPLLQRYASFWLTELMYFCYASFYFFIPGIGIPLYFRKCSDEISRPGAAFREFMLAISLTFWVCYLHFLFTPAGGPIFWPDYGSAVMELRGGPITTLEQWIFENGTIVGGAFPSSHVAVAMVATGYAVRFRVARFFFLPLFIGLVVSTLYNGYHYGVDVVYAMLIATVMRFTVVKVFRWREHHQ